MDVILHIGDIKGKNAVNANLKKIVASGIVATVLLFDISLFYDFFYPFYYLWEQGELVTLFLSVTVFLWTLLGAFFIFFSGRSRLRRLTLPFFLFFFLFNLGSYNIAGSPIDFQQTTMIVENFQWWFWEVVENFGLASLPFVIILVPVIIFVERLPEVSGFGFSKKVYIVPLSALVLCSFSLKYSNGFFDRYPSFFRVPAILLYAGQSQLYEGERAAVTYTDPLSSRIDKIILIVDESIRADVLGNNGYEKETTPYLSALENGVVNLGLAAASSNCSDYSNLILRTGVQKEAIPDLEQMTLKRPSIWQFTSKAGYYNAYLDAQSAEEWSNYQNFMNAYEASFVDEIFRLRQDIPYESDGVAREKLIDFLKRPGKAFIMLNKYGMHFPYFRSHPKEYGFFTPVLEQGEPMNDRVKSLNSYMNGIRWSVDEWFTQLLTESGEYKRYVIIYTSDHGQNIVDDGTLATHCRPRGSRFEGIVPMMVFSNDDVVLDRFKAAKAAVYNRTSHFQIFPTLLELAGYNDTWVRGHYGASLSEPAGSPPEYFSGDIHGRGSVRQWIPIFPVQVSGNK